MIFWIVGLPCSGKTRSCSVLQANLKRTGGPTVHHFDLSTLYRHAGFHSYPPNLMSYMNYQTTAMRAVEEFFCHDFDRCIHQGTFILETNPIVAAAYRKPEDVMIRTKITKLDHLRLLRIRHGAERADAYRNVFVRAYARWLEEIDNGADPVISMNSEAVCKIESILRSS